MVNKLMALIFTGIVCIYTFLGVSYASSSGVVPANVVVYAVAPANIVITNLTTASSVTVGAQVPLYATVNNIGYMAATNMILNVSITGAVPFNSIYSIPSLSPQTSENVTIQISGASSVAGAYTLNAFVNYESNSMTLVSDTRSAGYTVTSPGPGPSPGGGGGGPPPVAAVPGINITSIPVGTSAVAGQGLSSQIAIKNNGNQPEIINFTVGKNYTGMLSLSTKSLYLLPGQTGSVTTTFKTNSSTRPGTYIIPLTINVSLASSFVRPAGFAKPSDPSQTEYLAFTVYSNLKNGLQIVGQTFLTNSLNTLSGVIALGNAGNSTLSGGTLTTMLPGTYARAASQISAFGLPNNITRGPNGYLITWSVSSIRPGQVLYAYYNVQNQSGVEYLAFPQNIFSTPSPVPSSSVLKVVEISAPSLHSNSAGYVNASIFYTGTIRQQISFYLSGPSQANVTNPIQVVNASPNQLLDRQFKVSVGNYMGTLLLYLYVTSSTANLTESIPIVVSPAPTISTTTVVQASQQPNLQHAVLALEAIAVLTIVLIVLLSIVRFRRRRPKYSPERERSLIKLRKRIRGEPVD